MGRRPFRTIFFDNYLKKSIDDHFSTPFRRNYTPLQRYRFLAQQLAVTTTSSGQLFGAPAPVNTSAPLFGAAVTQRHRFSAHRLPQPASGQLFAAPITTFAPPFSALVTTSAPPFSALVTTSAPPFSALVTTSAPLFGASITTSSAVGPLFGVSSTSGSLFTTTSATTSATNFGTPTTTSKMNFKSLEEILLKLRIDFEQQEKAFLDEVDDLNAFDIVLRRAQNKTTDIVAEIDELEQERDRFVWEMDILAQQQTELEQLVTEMEKQLALPQAQPGQSTGILKDQNKATPADKQRENILQLQISVNAQLKQLDDELGDLCEQIGDLQRVACLPDGGTDSDRSEELEERRSMVQQMRQILRSQLETLVWVDKQSEALLERVNQATADVLTLRR